MDKPHAGLDDCLTMLQACFRKRMSEPDDCVLPAHVHVLDGDLCQGVTADRPRLWVVKRGGRSWVQANVLEVRLVRELRDVGRRWNDSKQSGKRHHRLR